MKKLKALHKQIKSHKYRLNHDPLYAKSFGLLMNKLVMEFYELTKKEEMGMYIHEALSVSWHFESGLEVSPTYSKWYKDGEEMDKDILIAAELIIGDIHRYIQTGDLSKLHMYYTGCNVGTGRSRKSTLIKDGKEYKQKREWK